MSWDACTHEDTELVEKISARGTRQYRHKCLACGRYVGDWLEENELATAQRRAARPVDGKQARAQEEAKRKAEQEQHDKAQQEWWAKYDEYMQSPEWQDKRSRVLIRAAYICEGCGKAPAVQVHHLTYDHLGDEFLWELRAVCMQCHERIHPHGPRRPKR